LIRCAHQTANHFIRQDCALARDRYLFDAALFVKGQQAVFFRARQDLNGAAARVKDYLLGNLLAFDDLDA